MFAIVFAALVTHGAPLIPMAKQEIPALIAPFQAPAAEPSQDDRVSVVPSYSQFIDIKSPKWQKVGCGITSLSMIIDYYHPGAVSADDMLAKGVAAGAYDYKAGWIYNGLIKLSREYGLYGTHYSLAGLDPDEAIDRLKEYLKDGPVIVSAHYKFDPKSPIPHLVVVNGIKDGVVYYNDPANATGTDQISVEDFLKGWKRRVIVIRPAKSSDEAAPESVVSSTSSVRKYNTQRACLA